MSCLTLTVALLHAASPVRKPTVEVPILSSTSQVVIRLEIDGKVGRFAVDSGSFELRIQPGSAKRLGLVSGDLDKIANVRLVLQRKVSIGGVDFGDELVHIFPLFLDAEGKPVDYPEYDGTIGLNMLRRHAWGLDLVDQKVAVWRGGKIRREEAEAWARTPPTQVPLTTEGNDDWYRVRAKLNGQEGNYLLDTGPTPMLLTSVQAKQAKVETSIETRLQFLELTKDGRIGLGSKLELPWRTRTAPWVAVIDLLAAPAFTVNLMAKKTAGMIGREAFSHTRTVFDFPAKRLWVAPEPNGIAWEEYLAGFGFRVGYSATLPVAVVVSGSIAEAAGLRTGDQLLEIDGRPVRGNPELRPPEGWNPGRPLELKVRRGDQVQNLSLRHP